MRFNTEYLAYFKFYPTKESPDVMGGLKERESIRELYKEYLKITSWANKSGS